MCEVDGCEKKNVDGRQCFNIGGCKQGENVKKREQVSLKGDDV